MGVYQCIRLLANLFLLVCRIFKQDCPVHIMVKAGSSGKELEVKRVLLEHNHRYQFCIAIQLLFGSFHILNLQSLYEHLLHQRKLTEA